MGLSLRLRRGVPVARRPLCAPNCGQQTAVTGDSETFRYPSNLSPS